ncbi:MAG: 3'-5' exonuclease domain-containing protein 2 [Deferribacterales bacterium]
MQSQETDFNNLTSEIINSLPILSFTGEIHHIDNDDKLYALDLSDKAILGFDIEIKPSFKKNITYPPSLIQLADDKDAYLFYLNRLKDKNQIVDILNNQDLLKVGSGIDDDIIKLEKLFNVKILRETFIDIQRLIKPLNLPKTNLRFLTALFLKRRIIKSSQTSNWSRYPLTEKQIIYAATDASVCYQIYKYYIK